MKRSVEIKYPHSAMLFQFCRRVLDHKFGGVRVIDQDVGQILGFDPADCSHWKKGKKNVRSVQAIKSIAEHLGVDERLVIDLASGDLDHDEAFFEFSGYGAFEVDEQVLEGARKEFMRQNAAQWSKELEQEFRTATMVNEAKMDQAVESIHQKISYKEAPLYIPELHHHYPEIRIHPVPDSTMDSEHSPDRFEVTRTEDRCEIRYPQSFEGRPSTRFRIAKLLSHHFISEEALDSRIDAKLQQHLADVKGNLFAAKLLCPAALLRDEIRKVNVSKDIVSQLAETFWVSKNFMNHRIQYILKNNAMI